MDEHNSEPVMLKGHPEWQYLNTLKEILSQDTENENRTGVDTLRILGTMHKYDFKDGFPLFTTKKTWFKGIAHELLWFLSGSSNIKYLVDNGVHIWDDDAYRVYKSQVTQSNAWIENQNCQKEYAIPLVDLLSKEQWLKELKEDKAERLGNLGPVYGVQWRRWDCDPKAYDQIAFVVDQLKNNPTSRRIILSAWNAPEVKNMGLPPCHVLSQYTVDNGRLWCTMYQRSCDMLLGVPFNVASYSLLTYMLAEVCNLQPGGLIHMMNDCHLYSNHLDQTKELLTRTPRPFPTLSFKRKINDLDDFKYEDFKVEGYDPYPAIKAQLNVG